MAKFLATINSRYGLVTITDSEKDPERSSGTIQIDEHCFVVAFFGIESAIDFVNKYMLPHKNSDFENLIEKTTSAFNQHYEDYLKQPFSVLVCTYVNKKPIYHAYWIAGKNDHHSERQVRIAYFVNKIEDLAEYLRNKVYSEHMSLEELKNLAAFITVQSIKVFAYVTDFGSNFDVTTLSEKGIKRLSEGEINELFSKQDQIDHKLKKIFSDFFINEVKQ